MRRVFLLSLLLLVATASFAEAGRKDDFDFAQGLVDRKYYDLAKKEFEKIIADGDRPAELRANGELGLALLLKAQAKDASQDSKKTTQEIVDVFGDAESRFDKFLESYPNHPKRTDARFEVAVLLQDKGIFLTTRMAKPEEAENADALRRSAEEAFDLAIDIFGETADQYEAIVEDDGEDAEKYDWLARRVRFFHGVCHYYKGRLYDAGTAERRQILEKAVDLLTDFVWENEDNILGGYAYFYLGLCKKELDEPTEALEFFTVASSNYPIPEDPRMRMIWGELFFQSYYKLGEYCNELKQRDGIDYCAEAVKRLLEMRERLPEDCMSSNFGLRSLLELARAHMNLGEITEAMDICSLVSQKGEEYKASTTWGAGIEVLANRLLNEVISTGVTLGIKVPMDPAKLLKAAMGKKTSREWDGAVIAFQQVVRASEGADETMKEFGIPAWLEIGECYYRAGKFLEAYFAYDHLVELFRGKDQQVAGDAAYFRYRAANAQHGDTKDPRDEELRKTARSAFAVEFKDHPRSIDLQYYEGADLVDDANARAREDKMEAERLYNQAIGLLGGVKRSSILYSKAKARVGEIYFRLEKFDEAIDQFDWVEKFVNNKRNVTTDREQKLNRLQALAIGTYYGALSLSRKEKWQAAFDRLAGYETTFADDNVKDFHSPVKFERVLLLLKLDRLDDAEKQGLELREMYEADTRVSIAFYRLAMAFFERSETLKDKDPEGWRANLAKAAEYFSYYITRKAEPKARDWRTIGAWYYKLDDWGKAEEYIVKALALYNKRLDQLKGDSTEKTEILTSVESLSVMLSKLLLQQGKFAHAKQVFEELLIPEAGARERVLALLKQQVHTRTSIKELMGKIHSVPSFMEGLAEVYINLEGQDDLLRAITLLSILSKADPNLQYSEQWWGWQFKQFRAYYLYGVNLKDQQAFENIIAKYRQWMTLGVIKNSGLEKEFTRIYQQALAELRKMGITPPGPK